jgi:hypothetical protein
MPSINAKIETPNIADIGSYTSVKGSDRRGRVVAFYTFAPPKSAVYLEHLEDIFAEIVAEEIAANPKLAALHSNQIELIRCARENARFIGLSSTAGSIIPLEAFNCDGQANWSKQDIEQANIHYNESLKDIHRTRPFTVCNHWNITNPNNKASSQ